MLISWRFCFSFRIQINWWRSWHRNKRFSQSTTKNSYRSIVSNLIEFHPVLWYHHCSWRINVLGFSWVILISRYMYELIWKVSWTKWLQTPDPVKVWFSMNIDSNELKWIHSNSFYLVKILSQFWLDICRNFYHAYRVLCALSAFYFLLGNNFTILFMLSL